MNELYVNVFNTLHSGRVQCMFIIIMLQLFVLLWVMMYMISISEIGCVTDLDYFECREGKLKNRYSHLPEEELKKLQPYFFLHIHKTSGASLVEELKYLLNDTYWCQFEKGGYDLIRRKDLFPYEPPRVIVYLREPLHRFLSDYDMKLSYSYVLRKFFKNQDVNHSDIDNCVKDSMCLEHFSNVQSKTIGKIHWLTSNLYKKVWFIGITEYFYTSLCMLQYKLCKYNKYKCDCPNRHESKIPHMDHNVSHNLTVNTISNSTRDIINAYQLEDNKLYPLGLKYFQDEIRVLERKSGIKFSCNDTFAPIIGEKVEVKC